MERATRARGLRTWYRGGLRARSAPTRSSAALMALCTMPLPPHHTAPPRWERDEEMEQPEGEAEQNTYGRLKSCTTLPGVSHFPGQPRPCEAGKWWLPRTTSHFFELSLRCYETTQGGQGISLSGPQTSRAHSPHTRRPRARPTPAGRKGSDSLGWQQPEYVESWLNNADNKRGWSGSQVRLTRLELTLYRTDHFRPLAPNPSTSPRAAPRDRGPRDLG